MYNKSWRKYRSYLVTILGSDATMPRHYTSEQIAYRQVQLTPLLINPIVLNSNSSLDIFGIVQVGAARATFIIRPMRCGDIVCYDLLSVNKALMCPERDFKTKSWVLLFISTFPACSSSISNSNRSCPPKMGSKVKLCSLSLSYRFLFATLYPIEVKPESFLQ